MTKDEIERRYLLRKMPLLPTTTPPPLDIIQYYTHRNNEYSLRVRAINYQEFLITYKEGKGLVRKESEAHIDVEVFEIMKKCAMGYTHKDRYLYQPDSFLWEIDLFKELLHGVIIAEIEIETVDVQVQIPQLIENELVAEVTYDHRFSNMFFAGLNRNEVVKLLEEYGVMLQ